MSKKKKRKAGLPPGSLVYTGNKAVESPEITVIQYNAAQLSEVTLKAAAQLPMPNADTITWYDVRGLGDLELMKQLATMFHIHPLVQEDMLDVTQRPKLDEYENALFLIAHALTFDDLTLDVRSEQISLYMSQHYLLLMQEDPDDSFPIIRQRLQVVNGRLRTHQVDFLLYAVLDFIIDNYFLVTDKIEEAVVALETNVLNDVEKVRKNTIYHLRRQLMEVRKAAVPLRDVVNKLQHSTCSLIESQTLMYTRDLYDHITQVIDAVDSQRDTLNNLHDLYHIELSNRSNHVMKVLTIVSAIFIPLTFIVGVYGTNFDNLPELHHRNGYYIMWGVMLAIAAVLLLFFKRKRWI